MCSEHTVLGEADIESINLEIGDHKAGSPVLSLAHEPPVTSIPKGHEPSLKEDTLVASEDEDLTTSGESDDEPMAQKIRRRKSWPP